MYTHVCMCVHPCAHVCMHLHMKEGGESDRADVSVNHPDGMGDPLCSLSVDVTLLKNNKLKNASAKNGERTTDPRVMLGLLSDVS